MNFDEDKVKKIYLFDVYFGMIIGVLCVFLCIFIVGMYLVVNVFLVFLCD